jgi:type II secretory pathway pseudopilin PulG
MSRITREEGFTLSELMISTMIMLIMSGAALGTFQNGLKMNDTASQMADATQNLRAGVNQLIKDVMQAGRIIGPEGVPVPLGTGVPITRPSPPGTTMTFDLSTTTNLPDITTGYQIGPLINGTSTDMITILTVDAFMIPVETPPSGAVDPNEGTIDPSGASVTLPVNSIWLVGDPANDTPPMHTGDLVLFKNSRGMAIQTVTSTDGTKVYFAANDWFNFNQRNAPQGSLMQIKDTGDTVSPWVEKTTLFRLVMVSYYVDNVTTPGEPRLVRQVNNFTPQALAGVVEDLDLTYDLVDGVNNPAAIPQLPYTDSSVPPVTYNSNQIRKVNIHVGVRSESISKATDDYIRNHISTAVDVRSLASVDRYVGQ